MIRLNLYTLLFVLIFMSAGSDVVLARGPGGPTPVIVSEVARVEFFDQVEALGTLKANESVDLSSTVTELVTAIHFEDGQRVTKGTVLVEMDAAEERAQLDEEQSRVEEARRQVERLTPLAKQGAASESSLDEWNRELTSANARIQAIQSRIDQRIIRAPYDGILGLRNISVGALAQPGTLITTIDDDSVLKLDFSVPAVFLDALKPGAAIKATSGAFRGEVFSGKIASVDSRVDPITRSITARALIENRDLKLKPGLLMHLELQKNPRQALVIPEEAIITDGPDNFVLVIQKQEEQTIAERRLVQIGARQFGRVEILSGLGEGDQIVTHGTLRVRPGSAVTVTATEKNDETLKTLLEQGHDEQE